MVDVAALATLARRVDGTGSDPYVPGKPSSADTKTVSISTTPRQPYTAQYERPPGGSQDKRGLIVINSYLARTLVSALRTGSDHFQCKTAHT